MRLRNFGTVSILATAFVLGACSAPQAQEQGGPPPPQVEVAVPLSAEVSDWNGYTGRFESVERVEVRARVSGYVKSVNFEDGSRVKAGELLFTLDDRPFRASLAQAEAGLAQARAELSQAQSDLERSEKLRESGAISVEELEQNRTRLASAQATVASAQAGVDAARLDLSFTRVTAPIDGRVSARNVDPGNLVTGGNSAGDILTTIVRDDELYFTFNVSESDYLRFMRAEQSEGAVKAEARLQDETSFTRPGEVVFADNRMGDTTGSIRVRALIENEDGLIRPGMTGEVRMNGSAPYNALMVPQTAIQTDGARRTLFLVNEQNEVEVATVQLGPLSGNMQVISGGIEANDRVIVNGLLRARPGVSVNPVAVQLDYEAAPEDPATVQSRPAMSARRVN
ncbi:efflux RND transporter periplasmic adaptor subunit [Hyphomonas sp. WL0036]|uniref:efflux RND transporter periplasmic adaptor subunit n=1 Tax=Hyphomonas sediminis TaxID=2866160 RepID=UPI001C7E432A|nr:efflux RND transporter periplasmic adaptor subunit [Hyphomonas sediminis]MBY9067190.1 efflux RND transporter periplasmic adaptor subunit [Hyphomonas sediminis]